MKIPNDVTAALDERLNGDDPTPRSMPPNFYTHQAIFDEEIEKLFISGWVCVGRADEVAEVGDYYTLNILNEPLIVAREDEQHVVVMSNV